MGLERRRVIVFDFDGVILESTEIKASAYRELFEEHSGHRDAILEYQNENGGLPRRVQIQHVYSRILGRALTDAQLDAECNRYGEIVFQRVMRAPFVAGAREFLEANHGRCRLYVASATPEEELKQIVRGRGIEGFFAGIFGAPKKKAEILRAIAMKEGCGEGDMVFIGDSPSDRDASREAGIPFLARSGTSGPLADAPFRVSDLTSLERCLKELFAG
ncbi:MAG: HAD hydrolase-like protein [bacterium]|nr:HAD hydrolase-like protein [bacterium]